MEALLQLMADAAKAYLLELAESRPEPPGTTMLILQTAFCLQPPRSIHR